jgi:hypothetical protein
MRTLHGWAFPTYINGTVLGRLLGPDGTAKVRAWCNIYYRTDFIGGAVFSTRPGWVDEERPDLLTCWYGQPKPPVGKHSGYWADPAVCARVDELST